MCVSEDDANQGDDKSDSESYSWVSITDSSPESVAEDNCLTCLDTEDATGKLAWKKFYKKMQASYGPTKQGLWKDTQLGQIENNHTTVWESDHKAIKTEWNLHLDRDPSSFAVSEMMAHTNHLLQIKVANNMGNFYPSEHKADVNGWKKALVQSLKQFHAHYYWLYEKDLNCAMVGLQNLHSGDALECSSISAGMEPKLFCP